ncbi:uncharacterized protein LOC124494461 isoform X2 [Dermatophagoides farinae]|uniref:uncharacterized protein LOC124494461 isoform X2 n=1 Tax=Dermatophagoides farinae TaxID=6954 RepID=UPI003F5E4701
MDHIKVSHVNDNQQQHSIVVKKESQTRLSLCVICKQSIKILHNENHQQVVIDDNVDVDGDKRIVCLQCQKFYNESIELSIHSKFKCVCNDSKPFDQSPLHCDYCRFNRLNQLAFNRKLKNNSLETKGISESRCKRIETITGGYAGKQLMNGQQSYRIYHAMNDDNVDTDNVKQQPSEEQQQTMKHRINNNNIKTIKKLIFLSPNSLSMFPFISQKSGSQQSNAYDSHNPMIIVPQSNRNENQQLQQSSAKRLLIQAPQSCKNVNLSQKKFQSTTVNNKNGPNKISKSSIRLNKKNFGQQKNAVKYRLLANKTEENKQLNGQAVVDASMDNDKFQSNRYTNFSLVQNPIDMDRKLSEALASLDSNRISKYRCPLEELFHNWTFFIDHISMIYWSCFGPNELRIELFIKKFWSFLNDFLCLYRSDQINDHAVISLIKSINDESIIHINQILLLHICWLKFGPFNHQDLKTNSHPWWISIKQVVTNMDNDPNQISNKKSVLLTEALDNIGAIADRFHVNDIELALVSTILLLKHSNNQSVKMMNNDNVACHVCHRPMFRLQQLFMAMLELFVDDHQQLTNVNDSNNMAGLSTAVYAGTSNSNSSSSSSNGGLTQLMLFLSPELEYFFALLNA